MEQDDPQYKFIKILKDKIKNKESLSFARFGDGEIYFINVDKYRCACIFNIAIIDKYMYTA